MNIRERLSALSRGELLMMLLALVYIISPIDVVPELLAGPLGLTDDVAAAALIGATMMRARHSRTVVAEPVADPPQG